jgi:hypothetical protein
MSEINENSETETIDWVAPDLYSKPHSWYAFVIDGEVAWIHVIQDEIEHFNAVLASDPKVVKIPHEQSKDVVMGWKFQDGVFIAPAQ